MSRARWPRGSTRTDAVTAYVALLRAVNVGGTGKLPMAGLKAMCEACGFRGVTTYIASGNVVFTSPKSGDSVQRSLASALQAYAGKPVGVLVRTAAEMRAVHADNPFPHGHPSRTVAIFLDDPPPADAISSAKHLVAEEIALGKREIYVHYGDGIGDSKLKVPAAATGTARNMNTVAKLAEMASALMAR